MICPPADALNMFYASDLQVWVMENVVVRKGGVKA